MGQERERERHPWDGTARTRGPGAGCQPSRPWRLRLRCRCAPRWQRTKRGRTRRWRGWSGGPGTWRLTLKSVEYLDCPHAGQSIAVLAEPVVLRGVRLGMRRSQERPYSPASAQEPGHAFFVVGLRDAADVNGGVARHVQGDCVLPEGRGDPDRHGLLDLPAEARLPRSPYLLHHGRSKSPPAVYVSQRNAVQFCSRLDFRGFGLGAQWAGGAVAGLDGARFDRTGRSTGRGRTQERRTDPQEGGRQTTLSASANFKLRNSKEKLLERGKAKHPEVITLPARGGGSACGVERGPKWIRYDKIR